MGENMVAITKLSKQDVFLIKRSLEFLAERTPSQNTRKMVNQLLEKVNFVYERIKDRA
jgi:hypothetical protein